MAMSEFMGFTHDCWWDSALMGAHKLAPGHWPLDAATLDRLVNDAIASGQTTDTEGAATFAQVTAMLRTWGWAYTAGWAYSGAIIPAANLGAILNMALTRGKPVLLALANGQALGQGDELGLKGHAIAVLGTSNGAYLCGDGDNPAARTGALNTYTLGTLEAAQPISAIILEGVPDMSWSETRDAAGNVTGGADGAGHTCGTGDIAYILAHGLAGIVARESETFYTPTHSYLGLSNGELVRAWHNPDGSWTIDQDGAAVVDELHSLLEAAYNRPAASSATPGQVAAETAVNALAAALASRG